MNKFISSKENLDLEVKCRNNTNIIPHKKFFLMFFPLLMLIHSSSILLFILFWCDCSQPCAAFPGAPGHPSHLHTTTHTHLITCSTLNEHFVNLCSSDFLQLEILQMGPGGRKGMLSCFFNLPSYSMEAKGRIPNMGHTMASRLF